MTTNEMFQNSVADMEECQLRHGTSRVTLASGDVLICSVDTVAGRSVTRKHLRTTYGLKLLGAQYAKPISQKKASQLLSGEQP